MTSTVTCTVGSSTTTTTGTVPGQCGLGIPVPGVAGASAATTSDYLQVTANVQDSALVVSPFQAPVAGSSTATVDQKYAIGSVSPAAAGWLEISAVEGGYGYGSTEGASISLFSGSSATPILFITGGNNGERDCVPCWVPITLGTSYTIDLFATANASATVDTNPADGNSTAHVTALQFFEADRVTAVVTTVDGTVTPEPASLALLGSALIVAAAVRLRRAA